MISNYNPQKNYVAMNPEDIVKIILISAMATGAAIVTIEYYIRTQEKQGIVTPPDPEPENLSQHQNQNRT